MSTLLTDDFCFYKQGWEVITRELGTGTGTVRRMEIV